MDGMPILFLTPVLGLATFGAYVKFLFNRKIFLHFRKSNEVHLAFDVPHIWGFNLKKNIQKKRDSKKAIIPEIQGPIHDNMEVPGAAKWSGFLANRNDKRKLVLFIGKKLLEAKHEIPPGKTIIASGCFSDNQTYLIQKDDARALPELKSNHEEADTRLFAHAAWSKITHLGIIAADTDIFSIFLLNHELFSNKQVVMIHGDGNQNIDMTKLANRMNEDTDNNLSRLRKDGMNSATIFGLIHILIGSDILCSPRGFGPTWILKTCLDFGAYLFHHESGIHLLWKDNPQSRGSYLRFILALFKRKYSSKIKRGPEELLRPMESYDDVINEVQSETWAHTFETRTMLPSKDCLSLRELNVAF